VLSLLLSLHEQRKMLALAQPEDHGLVEIMGFQQASQGEQA
jgi:hypothetical protein